MNVIGTCRHGRTNGVVGRIMDSVQPGIFDGCTEDVSAVIVFNGHPIEIVDGLADLELKAMSDSFIDSLQSAESRF